MSQYSEKRRQQAQVIHQDEGNVEETIEMDEEDIELSNISHKVMIPINVSKLHHKPKNVAVINREVAALEKNQQIEYIRTRAHTTSTTASRRTLNSIARVFAANTEVRTLQMVFQAWHRHTVECHYKDMLHVQDAEEQELIGEYNAFKETQMELLDTLAKQANQIATLQSQLQAKQSSILEQLTIVKDSDSRLRYFSALCKVIVVRKKSVPITNQWASLVEKEGLPALYNFIFSGDAARSAGIIM